MRVKLFGPGIDSFPAALDEAGIEYEKHTPRFPPGVIVAATGDVLQFVEHAIPWASVATVLVAWIRAKSARSIKVTMPDKRVIHAEGFSREEFEQVLQKAAEVAVFDLNKPDHK